MLRFMFGKNADILRGKNIQVLLVASILAPFGSVIISPILDSLIQPYGTSAASIGLMLSFFTGPAIVMIPIAGMLADRYGRKPILIAALLFSGCGTFIAFTSDFQVVLGIRLLQGVGFAGLVPTIITSIGDLHTGSDETTGQGIRIMVVSLSATIFPLIAGYLVVYSWRYPFLLYAIAFPIAVVVYFLFDDTNPAGTSAAETTQHDPSYRRELYRLVKHRKVLFTLIARSLPIVIWIGFITYNSIIVVNFFGGTAPQAGILASVGFLGSSVVSSQTGRITAVFNNRIVPLFIAHFLLGVGFGLLIVSPTIVIGGLGVTLAGVGLGIVGSLYRSVITGFAPQHLRAGLVSIAEVGGRTTVTLTPVLMGAVVAYFTPVIGFKPAIQLASFGCIAVGTGGASLCLLIAHLSPPISGHSQPVATD